LITILQIHNSDEEPEYKGGDILAFLPGQEDIEDVQELLNQKLEKFSYKYEVFPLFSALPNQEQLRIFQPLENKRKIILATNIAETSLTIKNIKYVIDSGFCKQRNYIAKSGIDTLHVTKISKNSSVQRAGRAGRESKGKCFRLFTEREFSLMNDFTTPEVERLNLKNVVLHLKSLGIDPLTFDLIDKPPKENFYKAFDELKTYGAIDIYNNLSDLGKKMCVLPLEPIFAKILINSLSPDFNKVKDDVLTIISVLQTDNIFYTPSVIKEKAEKIREKFTHQISDHLTFLNVFNQWKENINNRNWARDNFLNEKSLRKANDIKKQLKGYLDKINNKKETEMDKMENILNEIEDSKNDKNEREDLIIKCLLTGYFTNIAKYSANNYFTTVREKITCKVHPTSILIKDPKLGKNYDYVIYNDLMVTNKHYIRCCTLVRHDVIKKYL
jgi:HrpA-like RNA helicase